MAKQSGKLVKISDSATRLESVADTSVKGWTPKASLQSNASRKSRSSIRKSDPRKYSELKERQLRLGRVTWSKNVEPQQAIFSERLFKELFLSFPEYEFFFMEKRSSRTTDVMTSTRFKTSMRNRVMSKLRDILEALDNPEELNSLMTQLGLYHAKMNIRRRHLDDFLGVLLITVRRLTGYKLQREEELALEMCFGRAFSIAAEVMDNWHKQHPETAEDV